MDTETIDSPPKEAKLTPFEEVCIAAFAHASRESQSDYKEDRRYAEEIHANVKLAEEQHAALPLNTARLESGREVVHIATPPALAPAKDAGETAIGLLADNRYLADVNSQLALRVTTLERESAALREELTAVRPYADCYKRVCESLGIEDNILSYVRSLQAALADGKGEGT